MANNQNRQHRAISLWVTLLCMVGVAATAFASEKHQDETVSASQLTTATLPKTFKKVWYRTAKRGLFKAYSDSRTLTVKEGSLEFTSKKINLKLTGDELANIQWGRMKGDIANDWAILSYRTGGVEATVGFKDGSKLGWGKIPNRFTTH